MGMRAAKVEGLLVERLIEARTLAPTLGVGCLESRLAKAPKARPELGHGPRRERERAGDVGKRLACLMASDDLLPNGLGNRGGHGVPPGDRGLQGQPIIRAQPCCFRTYYAQHYSR
jgi:hypothetical protein